jgi:hypothetical protein
MEKAIQVSGSDCGQPAQPGHLGGFALRLCSIVDAIGATIVSLAEVVQFTVEEHR